MRRVHDVLRLKFEGRLSDRQVGLSLGIPRTTVQSRRAAPRIRRSDDHSGWGSLRWPQVGEFGWPPGIVARLGG